jgi:hypothetical protein
LKTRKSFNLLLGCGTCNASSKNSKTYSGMELPRTRTIFASQ